MFSAKNIFMPVLALALLAGCTDKELEQPQGVWPDYLRSESGEISIAAPSGSEFGPADNITVFSFLGDDVVILARKRRSV